MPFACSKPPASEGEYKTIAPVKHCRWSFAREES
jgi:hypothetical protein